MAYNSYRSHRSSPRGFNARAPRFNHRKEDIHPSRFVKAAKLTADTPHVPKHNFEDFGMHELLLQNISNKGITVPTPIQDQAIPAGLAGQDVVGVADTGTGKTLAFVVAMLHKLINEPGSRALIMAPTRELADQIDQESRSIGKGAPLFGTLLIGGKSMGPQLRDLRNQPQIVIGTPGRIKDHLERRSLDLSNFNIVVLDEVDRMLDMGFINDMRAILGEMKTERQSFFFSATLDPKVRNLIDSFSQNPVMISVKTGETTDTVEQSVIRYRGGSEKLEKLHETLISGEVQKALVFDETKRNVERLSIELLKRGFAVDAIHGGKSQNARQRALNRFKSSEVTVLVATDVAARGIDVAGITHVINYATPSSYSDYIHRIGRAGRAGQSGYALTFIEG